VLFAVESVLEYQAGFSLQFLFYLLASICVLFSLTFLIEWTSHKKKNFFFFFFFVFFCFKKLNGEKYKFFYYFKYCLL